MTNSATPRYRRFIEPSLLVVSLIAGAFYGGWEGALGVVILFAMLRLGLLF
jgi:hypothetical protein